MQLNPDCIRDILLEIESTVTFDNTFDYDRQNHPTQGLLSNYTPEEIIYHIRQCDLHGFLYHADWNICEDVTIQDLSPSGHQFLCNIRSNTVWTKTKYIAGKIGSFSIDFMAKIASNVVTELVKQYLNLV